jgi:hypothetical protein
MSAVPIILISIGAMALVVCLWMLICNERTWRQRMRIVEYIFDHDNYQLLLRQYDAVCYDKHLHTLAMLRNPRNLYHKSLWGAFL